MLGNSVINAQQLWQISTPDGAHKSYLLATQHIKYDIADLQDEQMLTAIISADSLVMPVLLEAGIYSNIYNMFVTDPNYELSTALGTDSYHYLESYLKKEYGLKLEVFKKIKPVFLYLVMAQTGVSTDDRPFVEEYFYKFAETNGKPVHGLESFEEQLESLDTLSLQVQLNALEQVLEQYPEANEQDRWVRWYKKGKLKRLAKWQQKKMPIAIYNAWVVERNKKLCNKLLPLLTSGSIAVLMPAYQLEGNDGLFSLLKAAGYSITKVN